MENLKGQQAPPDPGSQGKGAGGNAATIRQLRSSSNGGLFIIVLFIAVSMIAAANLSSLASVPASVRRMLGTGPSAMMISVLLIIYAFSAILTTLSRMTTGSGSYGGITHIGYLAAFYFFYYFTGSLAENFWAVFAAGMTILGLEAYHRWNWCREEIKRLEEFPFHPPSEE